MMNCNRLVESYLSPCECMGLGLTCCFLNSRSLLATVDKGQRGMWHQTLHSLRNAHLSCGQYSTDCEETIHLDVRSV